MARIAPLLWGSVTVIFLAASVFPGQAEEEDTNPFARFVPAQSPAAAVLGQRTIPIHASGDADLDFNIALQVMSRSNLLDAVQAAYAELQPQGETPEFHVQTAQVTRPTVDAAARN